MKEKQRCRRTGKRRYRDHEEAVGSLQKIGNNSTREVVPVRAYECDFCDGWHVTSQEVWGRNASDPTRRRGR